MSHSRRLLVTALFAAASLSLVTCGPAKIEDRGGDGGSDGEGQGGDGSGNAGSSGKGGAGGGFTLPDAGSVGAGGKGGGGNGTGGTSASCAEEVQDGKLVPLDLLLLVDRSGSMEESAGMQSKWGAVRAALDKFVKDPQSAGLGVGLQFFPAAPKSCKNDADCGGGQASCELRGVCTTPANVANGLGTCNTADGELSVCGVSPCTAYGVCSVSGLRCVGVGKACPGGMAGDMCTDRPHFCVADAPDNCEVAHYAAPLVDVADLPGAQGALSAALASITPQGKTPTTPAVKGALDYLRMRAAANPNRKPVLVLATDGLPNGCASGTFATVTALEAGRTAQPGIPTYVIGVFSSAQLTESQDALKMFAMAGGTGEPFLPTTGNDLTQKFLDAINQIRGKALGCEFTIPAPTKGTIDFGKVNVSYKSPAGTEDLNYVETADRCDPTKGGWYYDVAPAKGKPTRVLLCPSICEKVKTTKGVSVQLTFGCMTRIN